MQLKDYKMPKNKKIKKRNTLKLIGRFSKRFALFWAPYHEKFLATLLRYAMKQRLANVSSLVMIILCSLIILSLFCFLEFIEVLL